MAYAICKYSDDELRAPRGRHLSEVLWRSCILQLLSQGTIKQNFNVIYPDIFEGLINPPPPPPPLIKRLQKVCRA